MLQTWRDVLSGWEQENQIFGSDRFWIFVFHIPFPYYYGVKFTVHESLTAIRRINVPGNTLCSISKGGNKRNRFEIEIWLVVKIAPTVHRISHRYNVKLLKLNGVRIETIRKLFLILFDCSTAAPGCCWFNIVCINIIHSYRVLEQLFCNRITHGDTDLWAVWNGYRNSTVQKWKTFFLLIDK